MYYDDIIKPRLLRYVGARPNWGPAALGQAFTGFAERLASGEIYPALPADQRQKLVAAAGRVAACLTDEQRRQKTAADDDKPLPAFATFRDALEAYAQRRAPVPAGFLARRFNGAHKKLSITLTQMYAAADRLDEDYTRELHRRTYLPDAGPLDLRELITTLKLYQQAVQSPRYNHTLTTSSVENYYRNTVHFAAEIDFLLRYLKPLGKDIHLPQDNFLIDKKHVDDFLGTVNFKPEHAIALTRYYVEHHRERFSNIQLGQIERQLSRVFFLCFLMQTKKHDALDTTLAYLAQRNRRESWINLSRPTLEDVVERLQAHIHKDNCPKRLKEAWRKFNDYRAHIPYGMEEVVTLYYPESDDVRKERQASYKNTRYGEREGARRGFVHTLAALYNQDLKRCYSATEPDIDHMRHKRSVPDEIDITIEHITDRKAGGTNLHENMLGAPRWLNEKKEKMIHTQLALLDPREPVWIITWHPKRNRFGDFPDLYIPEKTLPRLPVKPGPSCAL